jgi:hypothetical protein
MAEPVKQVAKVEKKKGIFDDEDDAPVIAPKQTTPAKN